MTSNDNTLASNNHRSKNELGSNESTSALSTSFTSANADMYEPPQIAYDRPSLVRQSMKVFAATMYIESQTLGAVD